MTVHVKICGLTTEDAVIAAVAGGVDAVGMVFFPPSPRHVTHRQAASLMQRLPKSVAAVGLFVDPSDEALAAILEHVELDVLQLHGHETPQRVAEVKDRFGKPVMKAHGISSAADIDAARAYQDVADIMLFDAKPPKGSDIPGGNAVSFDWDLLAGLDWPTDWMLAGGLNPDNVADAVQKTGAPWVDVSSGVEVRRGVKDARLINAFLDEVRKL